MSAACKTNTLAKIFYLKAMLYLYISKYLGVIFLILTFFLSNIGMVWCLRKVKNKIYKCLIFIIYLLYWVWFYIMFVGVPF